MIHSLWIIKDNICIFYTDCECCEIDKDLFSGLLSAMSVFSREMTKREIKTLILEDLKLVIENNNGLFFVLSAEKKDNNILLHKKLVRIQVHFFHEFHEILPIWVGDTSVFSPFREKVEKVLSYSIEGTVMFCEHCEKIIPDKYITKTIDNHDFYFCCENCRKRFAKLHSRFIPQHTHY